MDKVTKMSCILERDAELFLTLDTDKSKIIMSTIHRELITHLLFTLSWNTFEFRNIDT